MLTIQSDYIVLLYFVSYVYALAFVFCIKLFTYLLT